MVIDVMDYVSACVDEDDLRGGSEIGSAVAGVGVIGAVLICIGSMSSLTSSALMIHEIDPTVKIWPGCGRDEEPTEKAILFHKETARNTPTWRANCRQNIIGSPPRGIPRR